MIINRYKKKSGRELRCQNTKHPIPSGRMVADFYENEQPLPIDLLHIIADLLDNKLTKKDFINLNYGNKKEGGEGY